MSSESRGSEPVGPVAKPAISFADLNDSRRDILLSLAELEADPDTAEISGMDIGRHLRATGDQDILAPNLYPMLDELCSYGLIEEASEGRDNNYTLTEKGWSQIEARSERFTRPIQQR